MYRKNISQTSVLILHSCLNFCDSWAVAHQTPLLMEFSRQEYWSGSAFPIPGDLPNPGIGPTSPALQFSSVQFSSATQLSPTLCDPMDCSIPGFPINHQLRELAQTHVHSIGGAIHHCLHCKQIIDYQNHQESQINISHV